MTKYYKLLSKDDKGIILKIVGRKAYEYYENKWVETARDLDYFYTYGIYFGMYEEITETEVKKLID